MGWELHITRADDWSQSGERPITADEWCAVVSADPDLSFDEANGPYFAVWSADISGDGWFDWSLGQISTTQPDQATLRKALQLAKRLNAKVQGDDGEVYTRASQLPDTATAAERDYLRWQRRLNLIGVPLLALSFAWVTYRVITWLMR